MNLVLLEAAEVAGGGDVILDDGRARHLVDVLRVVPGTTVRAGVVDGPRGTALVTAISARTVTLRCALESAPPALPRVDLLLAVPRPKVLRRLWAQLAALGVGNVILTNAARVERNYFDAHVLEPASYRPLLLEGLQQARDTRLPRVSVHRQFRILVEDDLDTLSRAGIRLVAHPNSQTRVGDALDDPHGARVLLAVGPEGGWNDFEIALLEQRGFQQVGLGARTLRVDTACIALLGILNDAIGNRDAG